MDGDEFLPTITWINDSYHGNVSGDVKKTCNVSWTWSSGLATVEFIAPISVLIVFNLVVIIGNILVIVAVSTHIKLRTVTNTFIISLAVADLMLGMTVLPFSSANEVLRYWPFGVVWCNIWLAIDVWLCTASILSLCAISLDRYLAISKPFKYPRLMSQTRARILVTSVWVLSFLICFPPLIGWKDGSQTVVMDTDNATVIVHTNYSEHLPSKLDYMQNDSSVYVIVQNINMNISGQSTLNIPEVSMPDEDFSDAPCIKTTDSICQLTAEPGYIIYSALGSFWIPVWIMSFFYWKIYRAAERTTSAIRRGVLTTKTSYTQNCPEKQVTLRVHRGGGGSTKVKQGEDSSSVHRVDNRGSTKVKHGMSDENSSSYQLIPTPASSRRTSDPPNNETHYHGHNHKYHRDSDNYTSIQSQTPVAIRGANNKSRFFHKRKQPKIRITFSKAEPNGVSFIPGERQPLRKTSNKASTHINMDNIGSRHNDIEETSMCIDETSGDSRSGTGFLNKVSRIQLKTHLKRINKEKKAAKTVGIIVGCFTFCWAPFFTVYLLGAFCPGCTPDILFTIFFWLGYCNSAVNPFLYAMCSKDFRYAFKKLLRCRVERTEMKRTGTRFVNFINSIRIQISTRGSDSNSE